MGDRKEVNKYISPDFDPKRLPRRSGKGKKKDAALPIRLMLPIGIKCNTCGEHMRAGKKFNATKETAKGLDYIGIKRFRFRLKCEVCKAPIAMLTDPKNQDYELEAGATRAYDFRLEQRRAEAAEAEAKAAEADSMAQLESRTLESKREMDQLDALERLREQSNYRAAVDASAVLRRQEVEASSIAEMSQDEEDAEVRAAFAQKRATVRRLEDDSRAPVQVQEQPSTAGAAHELEVPGLKIVARHKRRKVDEQPSASHAKPAEVVRAAPSQGLGLGGYASSSDSEPGEAD